MKGTRENIAPRLIAQRTEEAATWPPCVMAERRELKFLSRFLRRYSAHIHVSRVPRSMYIVVHKGQGNARRRLLSSENLAPGKLGRDNGSPPVATGANAQSMRGG